MTKIKNEEHITNFRLAVSHHVIYSLCSFGWNQAQDVQLHPCCGGRTHVPRRSGVSATSHHQQNATLVQKAGGQHRNHHQAEGKATCDFPASAGGLSALRDFVFVLRDERRTWTLGSYLGKAELCWPAWTPLRRCGSTGGSGSALAPGCYASELLLSGKSPKYSTTVLNVLWAERTGVLHKTHNSAMCYSIRKVFSTQRASAPPSRYLDKVILHNC